MENKVSVSYDSYKIILNEKEVLVTENEKLEDIVKQLKKDLEQEKADHTMDQSRVIYAHYILNGCRDDKVLLHMDEKERKVVFWKMKYDKVYSEMEHYKKLVDTYQIKDAEVEQYQKSNKAWQKKYEQLFEKNQVALKAIRELEYEIDRLQSQKRCCK